MKAIDINDKDYYEYGKPELRERTKKRLTQLVEAGMEEFGNAQFGVRDIMSGLYIELVWSFTDEKWNDYLNWAIQLIKEKRWKKSLSKIKEGAFIDELRYIQNQLLNIPAEEHPSEEELLEFIIENLKKDLRKVFVHWDELNQCKKEVEEERSSEQNKRMRDWFEERTGLKGVSLNEHMKKIGEMLNLKLQNE